MTNCLEWLNNLLAQRFDNSHAKIKKRVNFRTGQQVMDDKITCGSG